MENMYPRYEDVVEVVRRVGLTPGNIICYSYYGSQLLGTAAAGSDTDVLVIVDTTPNTGSTHTPTVDARIIPATRLEQGMRGFFDVWAAGRFQYPRNHTNQLGEQVHNPWESMVRSWRPSVYQAAQDAQRITRTAEKSLKAAITRAEVPEGRILKLCRRTVKQRMVAQKINTYLTSIYTPSNTTTPTYTPLFTPGEQKHLTREATALYNTFTAKTTPNT